MLEYKRIYERGKNLVKSGDLVDAIQYFNVSKEDKELRLNSIINLFNLYIRLSNYLKCRQLIQEAEDLKDLNKIMYLEAQIEMYELNCQYSLEKYRRMLNSNVSPSYLSSFFGIADIYSFFGFNDVSRCMCETTLMDPKCYVSSAFRIFNLDLLEQDYVHAKKVLESNDMMKEDMNKYEHCSLVVDYFLGEDISKYSNSYIKSLLMDDTLNTTYNHILKHRELSKRDLGYFNHDVNLHFLLEEARERIKNINGTSLAMSDYYRFRTSKVIGTFDGQLTQDICVTTISGTDKIITMYPVRFSEEFNREGLLENQELLLRRSMR